LTSGVALNTIQATNDMAFINYYSVEDFEHASVLKEKTGNFKHSL